MDQTPRKTQRGLFGYESEGIAKGLPSNKKPVKMISFLTAGDLNVNPSKISKIVASLLSTFFGP